MNTLRRTFRSWWQTPRRTIDRDEHRTVTFLELFYDLVYVVIIAELAHVLAEHVTLAGVANFAFMFAIVWWAWLNGTIYHDLHGNDDIRTRVFTFLQMFTVVAMAIFAHNALGEGSVGFALSYAGFQLILTFLWWRTGVHDPAHRPLSRPYVFAFLFTTLLFVGSAWPPLQPWRFTLWGLAVVVSLLLPLFTFSLGKNNPQIQAEIDRSSTLTHSAVERFGLFNIIVLGEVVVGVVQGVSVHHDFNLTVGVMAALGLLAAIGLWWVYFDSVSHRLPIPGQATTSSWLYLHLPMTIGIAATGAGVLNVVEHAGEHMPGEVRWLLAGAIAIALVSIALMTQTVQLPDINRQVLRVARWVMLASGAGMLLVAASGLSDIPFMITLLLLLLAPVLVSFWVWITALAAEQ